MDDYRYIVVSSPMVWCYKCKRMVAVDEYMVAMKTVYRTTSQGIYPYGLCTRYQCRNLDPSITTNQTEKT